MFILDLRDAMIASAIDGAGVVVSNVNIAISSNKINANDLLKKIQNAAGGKGGGSPKAANGKLSRNVTTDDIITILKEQ